MFIIVLTYKKELEEVEKELKNHMDFMKKYYDSGKFICSGRKVPRTGGVILCKVDDIEEIQCIIKEDPFYEKDIANYELIEFTPTSYVDGFERFITHS